MSSIGSVGVGYGFMNTLITNAGTVHEQLNKLTEQASSGLVAQTYAGLGASASVSLNLNPQLTALQTYQTNISQATAHMQVTRAAMTQLQQVAANFVAAMPNLNNLNTTGVDTIASRARDALTQVAGLLNTQDGGVYVFGGQDASNPPVSLSNLAAFSSQINTAVSGLSTNTDATAAGIIHGTLVAATTTATPFSAYMVIQASLSQAGSAVGVQVVQTGDGQTAPISALASVNLAAASSSTPTGSAMLDLMRALATIGSMSSSQVNDTGFTALVQDTTTNLNHVVTAMATDAGVLGDRQSALTKTQTHLSDTATALTGQVSAVQDVDMAVTLSKLSSVQAQLQASYRMIVNEGTLSLASFLPA